MREKQCYLLISGLIVGLSLLLGACGRSDSAQAPTATQAPASVAQPAALATAEAGSPTPVPRLAATAEAPKVPPLPTLAALAATVAQAPPPRGFADAAPPSRTPQPAPAGACPGGCNVPPQGCLIKGTLPRTDYKVFLLPGQPEYAAAQIDAQKGERWFCTIAEARAAGWAPSKEQLPARAPGP